MHSTTLIALFAASALAGPVLHRAPATGFEACERAENCEVIDIGDGAKSIRFIPGQEPGTSDHTRRMAKHKRDGEEYKTYVTLGDSKVEYGCAEPGKIDPVAMLGNLDKPCKTSGACVDSEPYTETVHYVNGMGGGDDTTAGPGSDQTWSLKGEGQYTPDMRDNLIKAIQALAGQGQIRYNQRWGKVSKRETPSIANPNAHNVGECEIVQQTGFYDVERYTADGKSLAGFMKATVSLPELEGGFCDHIGPMIAAGAVAGAIPAAGGPLAGVFGLVVAACNM